MKKKKSYKRIRIDGKSFAEFKYKGENLFVSWSSKKNQSLKNIREYKKIYKNRVTVNDGFLVKGRATYKVEKLIDKESDKIYYAKYSNERERAVVIRKIRDGILNSEKYSQLKVKLISDPQTSIKERSYISKLYEKFS